MTKLVLGKGLSALIPTEAIEPHSRLAGATPISATSTAGASDKSAHESNEQASPVPYKIVAIELITPNSNQPRQQFEQEPLSELANSIKLHGLMQPIVVRADKNGYSIIAGERRYRAAMIAGLAELPVVVMDDIDDNRTLELALIENIHREDLNPIELAEAYRRLINQHNYTQQHLADKLGKSRAALTNSLRLLALPVSIQSKVRAGEITEGHARALLSLSSERDMIALADQIVSASLSVRDVERASPKSRGKKLTPKRLPTEISEIETRLKRLLGTSVKIHHGLSKGSIQIDYYGPDDLERLYELFAKIDHAQ